MKKYNTKILWVTKIDSYLAPARGGKYYNLLNKLSGYWDITVLSPKEPFVNKRKDFVKVKVVTYKYLGYYLRKIYYRLKQTENKKTNTNISFIKNFSGKIKSLVYYIFPDAYVAIIPIGLIRAIRYVRTGECDILVSACYPNSNLFIGYWIKKFFPKIRWIIEMRDPFANYPLPLEPKPDLYQKLNKKFEKKMVNSCDEVWIYKGWFPGGIEYFERNYPRYARKIVELPYAGFNKNIFKNKIRNKYDKAKRLKLKKECVILHAGNFYGGDYSPINLFRAAAMLNKSGVLDKSIQFEFYGGFDEVYWDEARRCGISNHVKYHNYVAYEDIGDILCSADVLLWVSGSEVAYNDNLGSKIFDYIGSEVPIITLLPEGKAMDFALNEKIEFVANISDVDSIARQIEKIQRKWHSGNLICNSRDTDAYSIQAMESAIMRRLSHFSYR